MPKRQSAEISPSASTKSRSTMEKRAEISCGLVLCGRSQRLSAHCFKLMLVSNYENTAGGEDGRNKMIARFFPTAKLFRAENMRVNLPAESLGTPAEAFGKSPEADPADHHQINVAVRTVFAFSHRAENERDTNLIPGQRLAQDIGQTAGFEDNVVDVWIKRMFFVCTVIGAVAVRPRLHQTETRQAL